MREATSGIAAVTLATALAVSGCAGGDEAAQNGRPTGSDSSGVAKPPAEQPDTAVRPDTDVELSSSPTVEKIKQRGRILVGISADDPRFVERDGAGEYSGFDVEIARTLAKGLDLDPNGQVAFRRLPDTMLSNGVSAGNVDILLGPPQDGLPTVGPYVVTGGQRREITVRPGDEQFTTQLRGILDDVVTDGTWQRLYEKTLGKQGTPAKPR